MTRFFPVFLAAVLALPATGGGITVTTTIRGPERQPAQVQLLAASLDGSSRMERVITVPGTETLQLSEGNWELSIRSPEFWSERTVVSAGQTASLNLWPAGTLRFRVKAAVRGQQINELRITFAPVTGRAADSYPVGETSCAYRNDQWYCTLPAGVCDLRVLSKGYAAAFRWEQSVAKAEHLSTIIQFSPGVIT